MRLVLLLLALLAAPTLRAQTVPDLVTDRPDQTESAVTVLPGWVQVEGGVTRARSGSAVGMAMGRIGVVDGFEVRLSAASRLADLDASTIGLGGKVRLWNGRAGWPDAALVAEAAVPTGGGSAGGTVRLALATTLSEAWSLGYNVGAVWGRFQDEPAVLYTFTPGVALSETVGAFVELYGEGEWPNVGAGLTYRVQPNVQLDVSGGHALRGSGYFVGVGASYRLPR